MADAATQFRISAVVEGLERVEALKQTVRLLEAQAKPAAKEIDELRIKALALGTSAEASTRDIKSAVQSLTALKDVTAVSSDRYKQLARDIELVQSRYNAATGAVRQFAQAQVGVKNVFDLSGKGRNLGSTQYVSPIGPEQLDYGAVSNAAQAQLAALDSFQAAKNRLRIVGLEKDAALNQLEIEQDNKAARERLAAADANFRKELLEFDRRLNARTARRERFAKLGQTVGAIAAGGVFGGPEGLIGGAIGAAFGNPLGGAAIGAQVGMFRQSLGQISDYVTQLNLAKVTLAQASAGQLDYNRQLETARRISADYSVGLKETIVGYAQVAVAAKSNNLTLQQTESIYRGVVAAGVAFGKSQEDIDAIITATVQVLSKGKLSAEELQGQIGERLPGAVAKFAAATGRSLPQLAKDLQDGKVTIADFVKFSEAQFKDYDKIAQLIGSSPEKAGARLKIALDTASENYGGFFQQIGAAFQDNTTKLISWANTNAEVVKRVATLFYNLGRDIGKFLAPAFDFFANLSARMAGNYSLFGDKPTTNKPASMFSNMFGKYTSNYKDLFPEYKPPAGAYGAGTAGPMGSIAGQDSAASQKAANDAKRAAEERKRIQEAQASSLSELRASQAELSILKELDPVKKIQLEYAEKRRVVEAQAARDIERALSVEEQANIQRKKSVDLQRVSVEETNALKDAYKTLGDEAYNASMQQIGLSDSFQRVGDYMGGLQDGIAQYLESIGTLRDNIANLTAGAFKRLEDAIVSLTTTGKFSFRDFAVSILEDLSRMVTRMMIIAPIMKAIQSLLPGGSFLSGTSALSPGKLFPGGIFANGAAFAANGIVPFASGGIFDQPTLFRFANGGAGNLGLMGEAGPEAIMPLKRGPDGKLGVAGGGGSTNVTVNVDAKGTSAQGDEGRSGQLARVVAQAVQAELIKQKRPGGILA